MCIAFMNFPMLTLFDRDTLLIPPDSEGNPCFLAECSYVLLGLRCTRYSCVLSRLRCTKVHLRPFETSVYEGGGISLCSLRSTGINFSSRLSCGEGGIRTPGTVASTPHFECGPFDHSGTSPDYNNKCDLCPPEQASL